MWGFFCQPPEFRLGWVLHPCEGRNALKNVPNRQEIEWSVCEEKNLDQKVHLEKKLEHFSEKKVAPPHIWPEPT